MFKLKYNFFLSINITIYNVQIHYIDENLCFLFLFSLIDEFIIYVIMDKYKITINMFFFALNIKLGKILQSIILLTFYDLSKIPTLTTLGIIIHGQSIFNIDTLYSD